MFTAGLKRLGYKVELGLTLEPGPRDMLVTWNRIGAGHTAAQAFEACGRPVLVTENASWGNDFAGSFWYTLARDQHNTAGRFPVGEVDRWDRLGVELNPWRTSGEIVVLPQRGIGAPPTAMPAGWAERTAVKYGARIRRHPGQRWAVPLGDDLAAAGRVVTWGSGAAVKALMLGIPVVSEMPDWIAAQDNTEEGRLQMFRSLAWAQVRHEEIASGEAFARLMQ